MRRKKRNPLSVTLFPFLAVMICTLGVLIVLLVLAVRAADLEAAHDVANAQAVATEQAEKVKQLTAEVDERSLAVDILADARQSIVNRVAAAREHRGHLESEIRQLQDSMAQLNKELQPLQRLPADMAPDLTEMQRLAVQIEQLKYEITATESDLIQKRDVVEEVPQPMYSIVPHAGSGGTFQRPIFIESTERGLTLQPMDILLEKNDFAMPLGPGNPLDAALLAIREHWLKYDQQRSSGSPYPLIVIRPGGAEGFALARRAMSSWEDEFGYELVEPEKPLDFGTVDPELKQIVQRAVDEAKTRQRQLASSRPAGSLGNNPNNHTQANFGRGGQNAIPSRPPGGTSLSQRRPGLTVSNQGGGFVGNLGWDEVTQAAGGDQESNFSLARRSGNGAGRAAANQPSSLMASGPSPSRQSDHSSSHPSSDFSDPSPNSMNQSNFNESVSSSNLAAAANETSAQGNSKAGFDNSFSRNEQGDGQGEGQADYQSSSNQGSTSSSTSASAADSSASSATQSTSLAASRGSGWALPTGKVNSTAYVRPIRLIVLDDRMIVRASADRENQIPIAGNLTAAVDPLINEIWQQIESWGVPGANSFWKPELRVTVEPGGQQHFHSLQALLRDSGIDILAAQKE